ncbi:MAG: MarR family transcriptional regulator [Candidatus Azobacteroides sp.]|nr:MarR family transcriptional regulator [Candidatus Azobacteroides sp.]
MRKHMYSAGTFSMTEIETIGFLFKKGTLLPSELASLTKITTQSMSQILRKMEENGMIIRVPSKEDRRKVYVSLTADGKSIVEKTRYERDEWLGDVIENSLTENDRKLLIETLPVLNKIIEAQ